MERMTKSGKVMTGAWEYNNSTKTRRGHWPVEAGKSDNYKMVFGKLIKFLGLVNFKLDEVPTNTVTGTSESGEKFTLKYRKY